MPFHVSKDWEKKFMINYYGHGLYYVLYAQVKKSQLLAFLLFQVNAAAEIIYDLVDPNANLIFGAVIDPSLSGQVSLQFVSV